MTTIRKSDAELQVVWAELYAPMVLDSQGDYATAEEIRKSCWAFMKKARTVKSIDVEHDGLITTCYVVENFIARKGDPDFIEGSWVQGIHIPEADLWGKVQKGELNGFSMEAWCARTEVAIEVDVPDEVHGYTMESCGHSHAFTAKFDEAGNFRGGSTSSNASDGHTHRIIKGTVTEDACEHNHRFSFEGLKYGNVQH